MSDLLPDTDAASILFKPGHARFSATIAPIMSTSRRAAARVSGAFLSSTQESSASSLPVRRWSRASAAMADTRGEKQPREVRCFFRASHLLLNALVIVDRSFRRDQLIGPAVPQNGLATAVPKGGQVRIIGADHGAELFHRLIVEALISSGRDGGRVQLRILREEVFEPVE